MDNLPQLANNPERFAWIRQHLYVPAVCDILDSLGYRDQAMHQRLRPLDPANCIIVGRARTLRSMETAFVVQSDPYGLEIEALDSLKLACCKVAVDACFLSSRIYCAGSGVVSWTRHSAERRSPRDAPTVGGWESCGRRGRGVQETTARTSYRHRLFVEHDLGESSGSTIDVAPCRVSMA